MNRRSFLSYTTAASVACVTPFGRDAWAAVGETGNRRLIVIFLRGAVDGLNVVVPYGDSNYYSARRSIAIDRSSLIDLDGHFGLHPALAALQPFWQQKKLAFIHAAGSPDPSRSHFDAQAMMEAGTPGRPGTPDGWLNRMLAVLPGPHKPTQAISIGPTVPRILAGPIQVANIAAGKNAGKPTPLDRPDVNKAFAQLYGGDDAMSQAFRQGQESRKDILADMQQEMAEADNGAPLANGFPEQARRLAGIIQRDPNTQIAFVGLGGWDTHINQGAAKGQLAGRLQPLGEGLATLANGLGAAYQDTVILVISEFGRTVRENGNGGTDHGHGNVMWVMGGPVNGGKVYGDWPGLSTDRLYQSRDLAVTTDFRTAIGTVVERHMRLPDRSLSSIFPEMPQVQGRLTGIVRA